MDSSLIQLKVFDEVRVVLVAEDHEFLEVLDVVLQSIYLLGQLLQGVHFDTNLLVALLQGRYPLAVPRDDRGEKAHQSDDGYSDTTLNHPFF